MKMLHQIKYGWWVRIRPALLNDSLQQQKGKKKNYSSQKFIYHFVDESLDSFPDKAIIEFINQVSLIPGMTWFKSNDFFF